MSRRIIGVTVGTPISPKAIERKLKPVKTVNGVEPDENGNVAVEVGGGTSITVDAALDPNSTNPVQNKVICEQLAQAEEVLQQLQGSIPAIDPDLTKEGQAADAKAVGNAFAQAYEDIGAELQALGGAIPTESQINALIDAKLAAIPVWTGGEY